MNDVVLCPVNPIGHEWDGLNCRWCPATRTPGEAIVSGLASRRGGDRESARKLLAAYRTEAIIEALRGAAESAAEIHHHCRRTMCAACEVRRDILDVLTSVADVLGAKATASGAAR